MIKQIYKSIMFRLLSLISIEEIKTKDRFIYLTFDDGPEPDITELVIDILKKYNAKATFFCTGENYEKYPGLVQLIKKNGHSFGNHTYSHMNGLKENYKNYIDDVTRGKELIQSNLFRPPWGVLSIGKFIKISKENKIIMWSISSNDTNANTNWDKHCRKMVKQTNPGSIVLLHFCKRHSEETKEILPKYMDEVFKLGFRFSSIN